MMDVLVEPSEVVHVWVDRCRHAYQCIILKQADPANLGQTPPPTPETPPLAEPVTYQTRAPKTQHTQFSMLPGKVIARAQRPPRTCVLCRTLLSATSCHCRAHT
jgi:hypothetical protein